MPSPDYRVVDVGLLKWAFGSSPDRIEAWKHDHRPHYSWQFGRCVMVIDGQTNDRITFDPGYKARRRTLRETDLDWADRTDRVRHFCSDVIETDPALYTVKFDGLEADDVIAFLAHHRHYHGATEPLWTRAVDKDLIQIPKGLMRQYRIDGTEVLFTDFRAKLPKVVQPYFKKRRHVLLYLAIGGDKSDSVRRILGNYEWKKFAQLLQTKRPFQRAYEEWGDTFLRNLYLTVLPGPWTFDPIPTPKEVLDWLCDPGYFPEYGRFRRDLRDMADELDLVASRMAPGTAPPLL